MERRLISPNFVETKRPAGLVVGNDESISLMINEEDHLRLQALQSGLQPEETFKHVEALDDELGSRLEYAFSDYFGFLTSCPTNTGTGMRVSVFIHLPALSMAGKIEEVIRELIPSEIAIRGFYGEGSEVMGHIFQVSNQLTLGRTEKRILNRLGQVAKKFVEMEREAREQLLEKERIRIEDKVYRAVAISQSALLLGSVELVNLLSALRLGFNLEIIDNLEYKSLNELLVLTQPAHIQKSFGREINSQKRDKIRAKLVRNRLFDNA
jgi:protein arginine kinase